ncbi:MAG: Error-prone repair protein ImuA [Ginsengibacter sp.]
MEALKANIIAQLKKDILSFQGFKKILDPVGPDVLPIAIKNAFPNAQFPLAAVHEFIYASSEERAATVGFVSGILASIMRKGGVCIWINSSKAIFAPALKLFGVAPEKMIFITLKKEKEILWALEEALKCEGLAAVIGEMQDLSFTVSRRLQLAVEKSQVTGFIFRNRPRSLNITAFISRWKIFPVPGEFDDDMPGVAFPRWKVELLKVRNGKTGSWDIEFANGHFRHIANINAISLAQQKKTG